MGVRRCTVCDAPLPGPMQSSTHADPAFCQRINAGRELMGRSSNWRWWAPRHLAALLNLWEPTIHADEQERLRGKAEALPHGLARNGAACAFVYFEGQQPCNCHKATFLALLEGKL